MPGALEFLLQRDLINSRLPAVGKGQWESLYERLEEATHSLTIWCALLGHGTVTRAMESDGWDLTIDDYRPGFSQGRRSGRKVTTYHSRGSSDGIRPIIRFRTFAGAFPDYFEMDEEFRLYHNLAEDKKRGLLLTFDVSGREIEVVRFKDHLIQAQMKYLRQFQAGTRLHLAVFFDSRRYSRLAVADVPSNERDRVESHDGIRWRRNVAVCDFNPGYVSFSRLLAKVILAPPGRAQAGIWPFERDNSRRDVNFIVGVDGDGNDVEHTSDPDALANYFGANPGAPHYLTPVYFRREVLGKYFAEPERYRVSDGRLRCLDLWSCQIDNDLDSYVVVFLGDLGRDLPYEERLHWRQFNVAPEGRISETSYRRSFLGQFADARSPDHVFRREYTETSEEWHRVHAWPLFLAPEVGDSHLLDAVRVPVTNSQVELDEQIGYLTKLLVDSLNEKELAAHADDTLEHGAKGIKKLDGFLMKTQFPDRRGVIQLLRDLQELRSTGSAHRKGSGYDKTCTRLGVDLTKRADTMRLLLTQAGDALRAIRQHYCGNEKPTSRHL